MASRDELARLRAEVRRAESRAGRKVRRLERQKGVTGLRGSEFDPRGGGSIDRLNAVQLNARLARVEKFISRGTQFVPDAHGKPIPSSDWKRYKRLESELNANKSKLRDQLSGIVGPGGYTTLEQEAAMRRTVLPRAGDPSVNEVWNESNRSSRSITSRKSLDKLIASIESTSNFDAYVERHSHAGLDSARKMLDALDSDSASELSDMLDDLTANQWLVLHNQRGFMDAVSHMYENNRLLIGEKRPHARAEIEALENMTRIRLGEAKRLVGWAKSLDI